MSIRGMHPLRGEVWWVRLDPTVGSEIAKTRPCIVVTNDLLNERRRTVVVVPISSGQRPTPNLGIFVDCGAVSGVAVIDQVRAAAKERLGSRAGRLAADEMKAIEAGLRQVLGMSY